MRRVYAPEDAYSDDILPSCASICAYYLVLALRSALTSQNAGFPLLTARASEHGKTFTAYSKPSCAVLAGKC